MDPRLAEAADGGAASTLPDRMARRVAQRVPGTVVKDTRPFRGRPHRGRSQLGGRGDHRRLYPIHPGNRPYVNGVRWCPRSARLAHPRRVKLLVEREYSRTRRTRSGRRARPRALRRRCRWPIRRPAWRDPACRGSDRGKGRWPDAAVRPPARRAAPSKAPLPARFLLRAQRLLSSLVCRQQTRYPTAFSLALRARNGRPDTRGVMVSGDTACAFSDDGFICHRDEVNATAPE